MVIVKLKAVNISKTLMLTIKLVVIVNASKIASAAPHSRDNASSPTLLSSPAKATSKTNSPISR